MAQKFIPYMQIRGGSSKGVFVDSKDLPSDVTNRDKIILSIVGGDARQIDGLGGANPLTSKVAIISKSVKEGCDVDYLFAQVVVGKHMVDTSPNCGNILSGVGVFAIKSGLVEATTPTTSIRVNMVNTNTVCELLMQTPNGELLFSGDAKVDGVEGTGAPIVCNYEDIEGSTCGAIFPTGNKIDIVNDTPITCIDNGMPVILIDAREFGKSGYESCEELSGDVEFRNRLEAIRLKAGHMMNLGDVTNKVVPKMSLISPPQNGGNISTRTFIPHACHSSIGVLGAVSVASACLFKDSVAGGVCVGGEDGKISVEHPSGEFSISLTFSVQGENISISKAGLVRTARLISEGVAYPHENLI